MYTLVTLKRPFNMQQIYDLLYGSKQITKAKNIKVFCLLGTLAFVSNYH